MLDCKAEATALLSDFFSEELSKQRLSLRDFEEFAAQEGTKILREAMEKSLEKLDDKLFNQRTHDFSVKEKRSRSLASTLGDLKFTRRIYVGKYGNSAAILDEALDVDYRSKISPLAFEFLVNMASKVSYQESSNILAGKGGSVVSANTIMRAIHKIGVDCKAEDAKLAHSLYIEGVLPESKVEAEEIL